MNSPPLPPTSERSDREEAATDINSKAALETIAHVSHFIDALNTKGQSKPGGGISVTVPTIADSPPQQQRNYSAEAKARHKSTLASARRAIAASPTAKSMTPRATSSLLGTASPDTKLAVATSSGEVESHDVSGNVRRDVHYYAILAQVQKIVQSNDPSMTLGKILADANKRGMSLDVVTEIYKNERFKSSAQKKASAGDNKSTLKLNTPRGSGSVRAGQNETSDAEATPNKPEVMSPSSLLRKLKESSSSQKTKLNTPRGSVRAGQDETSDLEETPKKPEARSPSLLLQKVKVSSSLKKTATTGDRSTLKLNTPRGNVRTGQNKTSDAESTPNKPEVRSPSLSKSSYQKITSADDKPILKLSTPLGSVHAGKDETSDLEDTPNKPEVMSPSSLLQKVKESSSSQKTKLNTPRGSVRAGQDETSDLEETPNKPEVRSLSLLMQKVKVSGSSKKTATTGDRSILKLNTPRGNVCAGQNETSDAESKPNKPEVSSPSLLLRRVKESSSHALKQTTPKPGDAKPRQSGEIASDVIELSQLCDQATTLLKTNRASDGMRKDITSPEKLSPSIYDESVSSPIADTHDKSNVLSAPSNQDGRSANHRREFDSPYEQSIAEALLAESFSTDQPVSDVESLTVNQDDTAIEGNLLTPKAQQRLSHSNELPLTEKSHLQNCVDEVSKDSYADMGISGLNESQLRQLNYLVQQAEELTETESNLSPGRSGNCELSPSYCESRRTNTAATGDEDIDAFFSRFSILEEGETRCKYPTEAPQSTEIGAKCDDTAITSSSTELSNILNEPNDIENHGVVCVAETILEERDTPLSSIDDASGGGDVGQTVQEIPKVEMERKLKQQYYPGEEQDQYHSREEQDQYHSREEYQQYHSREERNNLPKHLGVWKSPWQRNHIPSGRSSDISQHVPIGRTSTAGRYVQKHCGGKIRQCFLAADKRLSGHNGYSNIDFYSLYEATMAKAEDEEIDKAPWEYRDVGQRFLHEKSLESRNWFGTFVTERGNDRVPNHVCRPKSLEIHVTKIPEPGMWSEDWFTTWKSRKDNPNNLITFSEEDMVQLSENQSPNSQNEKAPPGEKNAVEIGSLCPVRVKGGERVSRIHPEFTSSLRQSRWRKKYLQGSMFPAN